MRPYSRNQSQEEDSMISSKAAYRTAVTLFVAAMTLFPSVISAEHDGT